MKKRIIALFIALMLVSLCLPLSVSAAETSGSASVVVNDASNEADDFVRYGTDEEYAIVPCNAGRSCIDLDNVSGTTLQLWSSNYGSNELWTLGKVGDYYYIKNKQNGNVVDVPGGTVSTGKRLQGYDYNGTDAQLWRLESLGDGTYCIHSKLNDSLVWDVQGDTWNDGSAISLTNQHRAPNQRFRFVHASTIEPMSEWGATRHDCTGTNWSVWDGSISSVNWYHAHSNEKDLYINSAADLGGLFNLVVNNYNMSGKTIHLMCDINLAGIQWTPIGSADHRFRGSFNGHNHTITGFSHRSGEDNVGLFGFVSGGTICNLAVKGTVVGDETVGGVVGRLESGHVCNIYSEVYISNATDDFEGGIVGSVGYGGLVDHCTQNADVNSDDQDPERGGIAGHSDGIIRYCVNHKTVNHNYDCGGGIVGKLNGIVEYCANHGTVGGGGDSERIGGIVGEMTGSGIIVGCFNDGKVFSTDDDYIGGICGKAIHEWAVICCINDGRVYGDDQIGGICGEGRPIKCLNMGVVTGDSEVGAISGNAKSDTPYCYALPYSAQYLSGKAGDRAEWATSSEILSGKICYQMNVDPVTYNDYGITAPFSQNIGSDPYPTFGSSEVTKSGNTYSNNGFRVTAECDRGYGSVEGAGSYQKGDKVTLTAKPAAGCVFDHFEVKSTENNNRWTGFNGSNYDHPSVSVKTYNKETITLTDKIDKSYTVKAVFNIFDDTPDDMKVSVKLELECTNDAGGWNSDILPINLVDSAGASHRWEANRNDLDDEGDKVEHTFDLGTASPVAVQVIPDFGGGLTFRSYGLKARMWVNGSGKAIESSEITIRSWPFTSSKHGGDYMNISFENTGNSIVGSIAYTTCNEAWEKGRSDSTLTIRLESVWLLDKPLELGNGQSVKLDLNGYPIIRAIKKTQDDGELFKVGEGATLTVTDSAPTRKSCESFLGGSIQGGRSDNTGGLIECKGKLVMTGGTLYNGGTTDKGGAIKLSGSASADLTGVLISNCWTDKAVFHQNEGGAIYLKDKAQAKLKDCTIRSCRAYDYGGGIYLEDDDNRLTCENVTITACTADDNQGGAIYQDHGETRFVGGSISDCRASQDDGGGVFQNNGKAYFQDVRFEGNYSEDNGGALYGNTDDGLWLIGCTLVRNNADDNGGAIYMDKENMYLESCSVTANTSGSDGGGIYVDNSGSIGVAGVTVIRSNDGIGTKDNLVLGSGALIYDHGLDHGSEVRLRSSSDGNVKLGGSLTSSYQQQEYFRADYGKLTLTDTQIMNTELRASVFSGGYTALIIGAVVIAAALAGGLIYNRKKRKGGTQ
ncbi:MAG: RICIN domain-containing protein [Ruminococcus sp.]|nr:RICIN domain-containing protein [Ruminococcus sp.]